MDINSVTDRFVADWRGKFVDQDGYYGSQCWDVPAKFAIQYLGVPSFPTGSGGAEGLFRLFQAPLPNYFDRLPASSAQKGDIGVMPATAGNKWGHTFIVLRRLDANTVEVIEQDGGNDPDGDGRANGVAYITRRSINSMSGILRFKGANMNPNKGDVDNILGEVWGRAPNPEDYGYTNQSWHDFVYNMLAAYPWQNRKAAFNKANADAAQAKKDAASNLGVAEIRSANFQKICDAVGVTRLPDEQKTTNLIVAEINRLKGIGTELSNANSTINELKQRIDELAKNPTKEQVAAIQKLLDEANAKAVDAQAKLEKKAEEDTQAENGILSALRALWRIITRKDS